MCLLFFTRMLQASKPKKTAVTPCESVDTPEPEVVMDAVATEQQPKTPAILNEMPAQEPINQQPDTRAKPPSTAAVKMRQAGAFRACGSTR